MRILFRGKEVAKLDGAPARFARKAAESLGKTSLRKGDLYLAKKS